MIGFGRIVDRDLYKKIQNSKLSKGNSKGALEKKKQGLQIYLLEFENR